MHACRQDRLGAEVELVAVSALRSGQEATISYTGPGGCQHYFPIFCTHTWPLISRSQQTDATGVCITLRTPSKEMMQQYGFVPEGGNAADRIPFRCARDSSSMHARLCMVPPT